MNPEELAKYRVMAEQLRKYRRLCEQLQTENAALRAGLTESAQAFDQENAELFQAVHRNHHLRAPKVETFRFA